MFYNFIAIQKTIEHYVSNKRKHINVIIQKLSDVKLKDELYATFPLNNEIHIHSKQIVEAIFK